jgi:hypothetical protein
MNKIRLSKVLLVGLLLILTACQAVAQSPGAAPLKPGDSIDGMSLTTGAADVPPLWVFCSPTHHSGNTTISNCIVPVLPKLGIVQIYMISDNSLRNLDWSEATWQLSIDDQPVDLEAFGTFDYVTPSILRSPSPVREVFKIFTAWDVVLTNLSPGDHTICGSAQMGSESYNWVIHLIIQGNALGTRTPWVRPEFQKVS